MINSQSLLDKALQLHQSGVLHEAIPIYMNILQADKNNPYLLFLLGTACSQSGRHAEGISYLQKSAELFPNPTTYNNIAGAYSALNRHSEAIYSLRKALDLDPNYSEGFCNLGTAQRNAGLLNESLHSLEEAVRLSPNYRQAFIEKGITLSILGNYSLSLKSHTAARDLDPAFPDCYQHIGDVLIKIGRIGDSIPYFDKAITLKPDFTEAFSYRAGALKKLSRFDEALADYNKAIELKPDYAEAYCNRANTLKELRRLDEALADYNKAIALKPDYAEALSNRGNTLKEAHRLDEALADYEKAFSIKSTIDYLRGTKINTQMHLSNWTHFENQIRELVDQVKKREKSSSPFYLLSVIDSPEIHKIASERYIQDKYLAQSKLPDFSKPKINSKIKIGYFSADFHNHATMHLIAELFEKHDKNSFEINAFSFGPITNDPWQLRAKNIFDSLIECHAKSDKEVAEISRNMGIDIAVDLKGFTKDARTGIFAERAAPIQVNFLGYPGTMGAEYIDYIIADEILIPQSSQHFFTEKIAYLPGSYQPNCRNREISNEYITRADFGLPQNGIVFASFNNNYKITPAIFNSWIRILKAVEGSVLWLFSSNYTAECNLRQHASKGGVDPDRIIFAQRLPIEEHLNRIRLADLMLDTFPCGAHTTCSDALRMGLPVLTLTGSSIASRVATSLLTTVGLSELATNSYNSYENLAIELANNPEKLTEIRALLTDENSVSPLFDSGSFAKNLESLYTTIHRRRCDGLSPDNIFITH